MKYNRNAYLGAGHGIYSVRATSSSRSWRTRWGAARHHRWVLQCRQQHVPLQGTDTPSCYANFLRASPGTAWARRTSWPTSTLHERPVLADGSMGIVDGKSKPGDSVDLRAETRVLAVVSNCPQLHNPCNNFNPTPIRVVVTDPSG